ncbi:MAG: hypothetical protein ABIZ30_05320 [Candidatus Limnocylindrales bacterium]
MSTIKPFSCVTCELEIVGSATFHVGLPFCCAGCAANGPCICSYDQAPIDESRVHHCLDVADPIAIPIVVTGHHLVRAGRR